MIDECRGGGSEQEESDVEGRAETLLKVDSV